MFNIFTKKQIMDFKSYFSDKPTVDISVVKISGKRLTKSVLNQILITDDMMPGFDFNDVKIIGYVNDSAQWAILVIDGQLFKSNMKELLKIIKLQTTVENVGNYISFSFDVNTEEEMDWSGTYKQLPEEDQDKFNRVRDQAQYMFTVLKSHQIYI